MTKKLSSIKDAIEKEIEDCIKRIACLSIDEGDYKVIRRFYTSDDDDKFVFHITVQEQKND